MNGQKHYWVGLKGGLIDAKHYRKMGDAIWLFAWIVWRQTAVKDGEGIVNHGHAVTLERISQDTNGLPVRSIRRWMARLKREGYIRTEYHGLHGTTFWILKRKTRRDRGPKSRARL